MTLIWVDWVIIAVIAVSGLMSLNRGFVKEALSLVIWIVAGVLAWMFGKTLAPSLSKFIETPSAQVAAASALLFVVTLLLGALVTYLLGTLIRITGLSGTDRLLGMVFGAARGGLLVTMIVGLLSLGPVQQDLWWQDSALIPCFLGLADWAKSTFWGPGVSFASELSHVSELGGRP